MDPKSEGQPQDPRVGNNVPSGRETYNLISDTVTGVNFRWRDNIIQAVVVLAFTIVGAVICGLLARPQGYFKAGILLGALLGMISGVVLSGAAIMLYRAIRHLGGKHD